MSISTIGFAQESKTVKTKGKKVDGVLESKPQRVERISGKDLSRRGVTDLSQALQWLSSGSNVSPTGTANGLVVDGLPSAQLSVLRDGLPISRPSGSQQGPIVDLSSIPINPYTIERIDIYRGVGPVGSGNAGGIVIDIITRRPKKQYSVFLQGLFGGVPASLYRQNYTFGSTLTISDSLQWSVFGLFNTLDALDINQDDVIDTAARQNVHAETTVTWRPNANDYLNIQLLANKTSTTSFSAPQAPLDDLINMQMTRLRVRGRWWLTQSLRLDHHSDVGQQRRVFSKYVKSSGFERLKAQTTQFDTLNSAALTWFTKNHDLGLELNANIQRITRNGETGALPTAYLNHIGIGLADTWYAASNVEFFSRLYTDYSSQFGMGFNAHTGGVWKLHPSLSWRFSLSKSRRIPTAEELFLNFDHSEVGYRVTGNENLEPETLYSTQSGLIWTGFSKQLGIELQGFYHRLQNIVSFAQQDGQTTQFTYENIAEAQSAGAQCTAQFKGLPWGLQLVGNYTFLPLAEDLNTKARLTSRAYHTARAELRGTWLNERLELWTDLQTRSALTVPQDSPDAPGYALLGVGARVHFGPHVNFVIDLNNLLNQRNATWGPTPGFNAFAMIRIAYGKAL